MNNNRTAGQIGGDNVESSETKKRPSSTTKMIQTNYGNILVTPKPVHTQVLSTKAA